MRKITIKLYITIILTIFSGILNAEDGSKGSPFTNIGHAHFVPEPGTYHFNIGGNTFSSHVDKDGWFLIAAANKSTVTSSSSGYEGVSAVTLNSDPTGLFGSRWQSVLCPVCSSRPRCFFRLRSRG